MVYPGTAQASVYQHEQIGQPFSRNVRGERCGIPGIVGEKGVPYVGTDLEYPRPDAGAKVSQQVAGLDV